MNKGISLNTIKMLSSKNMIDGIRNFEQNDNLNGQILPTQILNSPTLNTPNDDKHQITNDTDYNFCSVYYNNSNHDYINEISKNDIKNMSQLNSILPKNFNWKSYSKFCLQNNENEILVKKNFIDKKNEKTYVEPLLNVIIIKTQNKPFNTIFTDFSDLCVDFSIITSSKEDIEHYNITQYCCEKNNQLEMLNNVIKSNVHKYFMIIYDYYTFEYDFITKIIKDINNLLNTNALLLIENNSNTINGIHKKTDFFRIKTDFITKMEELFICVISDEIKKTYDYSLSEIGIILYINQIISKYNSVLATTDYLFKNNIDNNNKMLLKDFVILFDLYLSNIENDILNDYDRTINETNSNIC
jgi:hypothetical protein